MLNSSRALTALLWLVAVVMLYYGILGLWMMLGPGCCEQ